MKENEFLTSEVMVMKLLHYFLTEQNYNPILLQGVENEIWLENLEQEFPVIRIVSNYIHNEEQMAFDIFKTKRIVKKIKAKTFSFHLPVLSFYLDLGEEVSLSSNKDMTMVALKKEEDLKDDGVVLEQFPDILKKLSFSEEGLQLFLKITGDINEKNRSDAMKAEEVFKPKKPIVTYVLILINVLLFLVPQLLGVYDEMLDRFCIFGPLVRYGEWYRLLTGSFLHAGFFHLLFNMYALYLIGSQVESMMGRCKYLAVYLFSALSASLLSITFSGNQYSSVGASGAIMGLMGCLLYFGYHYRVYLGNVLKSQLIPLSLLNLLLGFLDPSIDNAAHIGGLIGGALMTMSLGVKYKSSKFEQLNGAIVTVLFTAFLLYMGLIYAK